MKKRPIQLLLLEDDPGDASLISEYLRSDELQQYEVRLVSSLAAGLASLVENTPEVILTDLGLPDSQGLDTFTQLHAAALQIPIIVLSGLNDTQQAALVVKAGAQDYLTKDEITSRFLRRAVKYAIERKQAIETLQKNEERFRLMFENAPVGYLSLDEDGCFLDVNISFLDLLGYTRQEVIGHSFSDFLHPNQVALFQERFLILTKSREVLQDIEFALRRRDGSFMEASFTTRLVRDEAGRFIRTHSTFQDISARKRSERAIVLMAETQRQIAAQTRAIDVLTLVGTRTLELIGDGYVVISQPDESGESTHVVAVYGIGEQFDKLSKKFNIDVSRMSFELKNTPPEDLLRFRSGKLELFEDGIYRLLLKKIPKRITEILEKEMKLKGVYTIGFTWDGIHHGGLTILAKSDLEPFSEVIETTVNQAKLAMQRIQSQEALSASEMQYRLLAENIQDVIWVMDIKENRFVYVSPSVTRLRGYTPQEVLAAPVSESLTIRSAQEVAGWLSEVSQLSNDPNPMNTFLVEQTCKDGSTIWTEVSASLIRDENGIPFQILGVSRDISERRQADQQIRLQAAALESAANAMIITDRGGSIQWINPAYEKLTGYNLQEAIGLNPRILKSGVQPTEFYKKLWDTILSGQVWHSELVNKRKDGSLYNEEETITPLLDDAGEVTHFIGIKQDVTQRKKAEEDLYRSESELRALFAALPDVVLMLDKDGRYLKVAESNQDLLFQPMQELIGKTLHDVFPLGEANLFNGNIQKVLNTSNTVHFEYPMWIKDRESWFAATITPMTENSVIWVARDITDNKKAELELQESEAKLRESQRVSRIGSYVLDIDTNSWTSSGVLDELFGIDTDYVKSLESWNGLVHPDEKQEMLAYFNHEVVENRKPFNKEYRIIRPSDGEVRWMWGLGSLSFDTDGVPQKMIGTVQDITQRKLAELAQQESHSLLQATLESTADGILVVDLQGRINLTNQNFAKMWGIPQAVLDTHDDKAAINYVLEKLKDPQAFIKKVEELYGTPDSESFDVLEFKDGRIFERISHPQYHSTTIVGRVWSFQDITQRKLAEIAQQESHSLLLATLESNADGILVVDLQGHITMTNQNFADMWGISRDQLEGNDVSVTRNQVLKDLIDPQAFINKTREIYADPAAESFDVIELNDGRIFERVSRPQYHAETIVGRVSNFRDITERKQAENLVRESEAKYRSLFDNVPDGVYRTTPEGKFLAVNSALVSILGFNTADELLNTNAYKIYDNENSRGLFLEEINRSGSVKNMELQLRTAQGEPLVGLENARAFRDENGEVIFYEGNLTDITERKQLETERQILLEIMQGLTTTDDLQKYLEVVHHAIHKVTYARNFFVALDNKETGLFELAYMVDEYDQHITSFEMGKSLSAYVLRSAMAYMFEPDSFDELIKQGLVESIGTYSPSWLGVPLIVSNETIGVMVIQDYENSDRYSEHDMEILTSISGQVAQAIRRKSAEAELEKLFEIEQRRSQRLSDLQILSAELNSLHTEQELLDTLVKRAALLSGSPICTVMLLDEKTEEVILAAHFGLPGNAPSGLRIPVEQLPGAAQAFRSGKTIIISNIDQEMPAMRKVLVHPGVKAFFAFPLVINGIVAGAVTLSSMQPRQLSEAELSTYQLLSRLASAALDNVRLFEGVNRSLQRMSSLRRVDMAISASFDLVLTLNILLEQVTNNLGVDAADILVFDPTNSTLNYTCGRGFRSQALRYTNLRIGEGFAGQAALERRTIYVADLQEDLNELGRSMSLPSEGFVSYWGVPLVAKGNIQGVLEVFNRQPVQVDQDWINFMETLAGQAAIAVDNVLLFNHLERSNADLSLAYDSTLTGWATALELRDNETEGHTRRVAVTTTQLAVKMGVRDKDLMYMRWGSLLHDIGKMGIPDSILLKPGPLSDEEWVIMRTHPVLAYEMLSPIDYLGNALDIPYNHHEKWDGSGYPRGLKGEQIPLSARIFAIIDVWDALTSDRPYRLAWSPEKTMKYILEQVGTHFDPNVATVFLKMIESDGKLSGE